MFGIDAVLFVIVFVLAVAGLIRGPNKELGVTMAVVVLLAVLIQFTDLIKIGELPTKINNAIGAVGFGTDDILKRRSITWFFLSSIVVLTAFLAYHGQETLAYGFRIQPGLLNAILGGLIGAMNGYFIGGSIWYYLAQLDYPVARYDWFTLPLTESATKFVEYLPQNLFGGLVLSAMALGLLWFRILK
jgi:uncharacterized membrane protein required for colicin V production